MRIGILTPTTNLLLDTRSFCEDDKPGVEYKDCMMCARIVPTVRIRIIYHAWVHWGGAYNSAIYHCTT